MSRKDSAPVANPSGLRSALLAYYRARRRDLPWRRTRDPYAIWVSEIMLQQTRVATVTERYASFLARFPNVEQLAASPEHAVCEAWAGLGYYRRARNLHAAARLVAAQHHGRLPEDRTQLEALPGIGHYTAAAISRIAFGRTAAVVDGNVTRVLSRLYRLADTSSAAGRRRLSELAEALVDRQAPGDWNQAMMELGATVCTPQRPRCTECPVHNHCLAKSSPERFPARKPAKARELLSIAFAWVVGRQGLWLERRPLEGLWAGLWELPSATGRHARVELAARLGLELGPPRVRLSHELSHRQVRASVHAAASPPRWHRRADRKPFADPLQAPLSALARKAIVATQEAERR